jgi:hypothetical protein
MTMWDCSKLVAGDPVCLDRSRAGVVVKVFVKYLEVESEHPDFPESKVTGKYSRRDGREWGGRGSAWSRSMVEVWNDAVHPPIVAAHNLKRARRMIVGQVEKAAFRLSLDQIDEVRTIIRRLPEAK